MDFAPFSPHCASPINDSLSLSLSLARARARAATILAVERATRWRRLAEKWSVDRQLKVSRVAIIIGHGER